jgi:hypothetical protein
VATGTGSQNGDGNSDGNSGGNSDSNGNDNSTGNDSGSTKPESTTQLPASMAPQITPNSYGWAPIHPHNNVVPVQKSAQQEGNFEILEIVFLSVFCLAVFLLGAAFI